MHPRRFWVLYIEGKGATIEPTVRPAPRCASDSSSMRKVGASFHVHSQWHGSFLTAINPYISPLRQICLKHRTEITVCRSVQMQLNGVLLTQTIGSRASLLLCMFQTAVDFDQIKRQIVFWAPSHKPSKLGLWRWSHRRHRIHLGRETFRRSAIKTQKPLSFEHILYLSCNSLL